MPNTCFVSNCKTTYRGGSKKRNSTEEKRNPSIFKAPSDPTTFDLWVENIPRKHRPFGRNDGICELHFSEDCIKGYVHPLSNEPDEIRCWGTRLRLQKGSVPTIFPDDQLFWTENSKRKMPNRGSIKAEITDCDATRISVNDESVAESTFCDSSVAELSSTDENKSDPLPHKHCASKLNHSTSDINIPQSSRPETKVAKRPVNQKFESVKENIKLSPHNDRISTPSYDIAELSPPESLLSNNSISDKLPSENDTDELPFRKSNDYQLAKTPRTSYTVWSLSDLYNYVRSLQSLKDDNFTCCRVKSAAILQQWHTTSYLCIKMIVIEENLRPQIFVENERVYCEELLTLNRISSETKLQSLITLVKELKRHPKISDFYLESFYSKIVHQN